jgi:hypothetical protein
MRPAKVLALFEKHRVTCVGWDSRTGRSKFVCDDVDCDFTPVVRDGGASGREKLERGHWADLVASVVSGQVET